MLRTPRGHAVALPLLAAGLLLGQPWLLRGALVLLAGSLQFGARVWEMQDLRVGAGAGPDAVHNALRTMIESAQPLPLSVQVRVTGWALV